MEVLVDLFNHHTIDYKLLTPSARAMIAKNQFSSILSGFYFRSSILNPSVIYSLSKVLKGSKVFTPTLGWSSYMLGFLSNSNITEYVGTDVIPEVCDNTASLGNMLFPKKNSIFIALHRRSYPQIALLVKNINPLTSILCFFHHHILS